MTTHTIRSAYSSVQQPLEVSAHTAKDGERHALLYVGSSPFAFHFWMTADQAREMASALLAVAEEVEGVAA